MTGVDPDPVDQAWRRGLRVLLVVIGAAAAALVVDDIELQDSWMVSLLVVLAVPWVLWELDVRCALFRDRLWSTVGLSCLLSGSKYNLQRLTDLLLRSRA